LNSGTVLPTSQSANGNANSFVLTSGYNGHHEGIYNWNATTSSFELSLRLSSPVAVYTGRTVPTGADAVEDAYLILNADNTIGADPGVYHFTNNEWQQLYQTGSDTKATVAGNQPYAIFSPTVNSLKLSTVVTDDANVLFPTYDGAGNRISDQPALPPPGYTKAATDSTIVNDFMKWNSAWQMQYIQDHGTGSPRSLILGGAAYAAGTTVTAVLAQDRSAVYIVDQLQKSDFAEIAKVDQAAIAATTAFSDPNTGLGFSLGLTSDGASLKTICDTYSANIVTTNSRMTSTEAGYFKSNIALVKDRIEANAIFDIIQIKEDLEAIKKRYELAFAYGSVTLETTTGTGTSTRYNNVISTTGSTSITNSYKVFVNNESNIYQINKRMVDIASTRKVPDSDKSLAAPQMIALLQLYTNLRQQYVVSSATEEINQQNSLIKAYGAMQDLVSTTSASFTTTTGVDLTETKTLQDSSKNWTGTSWTSMTDEQKRLAMMFDSKQGTTLNPIESVSALTRPTIDLVTILPNISAAGLVASKKSVWDGFGTNLGDAVTQLSNQTQLKSNKVNTVDGERNKHFDLANSSLARMQEIITNIVGAID
jgi:hypothetical protein